MLIKKQNRAWLFREPSAASFKCHTTRHEQVLTTLFIFPKQN